MVISVVMLATSHFFITVLCCCCRVQIHPIRARRPWHHWDGGRFGTSQRYVSGKTLQGRKQQVQSERDECNLLCTIHLWANFFAFVLQIIATKDINSDDAFTLEKVKQNFFFTSTLDVSGVFFRLTISWWLISTMWLELLVFWQTNFTRLVGGPKC